LGVNDYHPPHVYVLLCLHMSLLTITPNVIKPSLRCQRCYDFRAIWSGMFVIHIPWWWRHHI